MPVLVSFFLTYDVKLRAAANLINDDRYSLKKHKSQKLTNNRLTYCSVWQLIITDVTVTEKEEKNRGKGVFTEA